MTGVDTDLATLRRNTVTDEGLRAADRVEAELADRATWMDLAKRYEKSLLRRERLIERLRDRATQAEAELARLREERDELAEDVSAERDAHEAGWHLRKAAEARCAELEEQLGTPYLRVLDQRNELAERCARLQQALEAGANYLRKLSDPMCPPVIRQVALDHFAELNGEALAGPDTTADSHEQRLAAYRERKLERLYEDTPADSQEETT